MKKNIVIIFGGQSVEHDISIESAKTIVKHIDSNIYNIKLLYISREGMWAYAGIDNLYNADFNLEYNHLFFFQEIFDKADVFFPILHGTNGEDGKIQSLLQLLDKPYVGANYLSSALTVDKGVFKRLLLEAGIPTPEFLVLTRDESDYGDSKFFKEISFPYFVKPVSLGSSVGISKVSNDSELKKAITKAFEYDSRVIIEKAYKVREIEVAVMGNHNPEISSPGELIPQRAFYDFEDKYVDNKTQFHIPAKLKDSELKEIKTLALRVWEQMYLNGMSRIDFFISGSKIMVNEVNTIPGFTEISMFPKLFNLSSYSIKDIINKLIDYGIEYHKANKVSYDF